MSRISKLGWMFAMLVCFAWVSPTPEAQAARASRSGWSAKKAPRMKGREVRRGSRSKRETGPLRFRPILAQGPSYDLTRRLIRRGAKPNKDWPYDHVSVMHSGPASPKGK